MKRMKRLLTTLLAGLTLVSAHGQSARSVNYGSIAFPLANSSSGTTSGLLVKEVGGKAQTLAATDRTGIKGICTSNCGVTGYASIAQSGIEGCIFDNGPVPGDYVISSSSVGGQCHDTGSAPPTAAPLNVDLVGTVNDSTPTILLSILPPGSQGGTGVQGITTGGNTYPGMSVTVDNTNPAQPLLRITGAPTVATSGTPGTVKPGTGCTIDVSGTLSCPGTGLQAVQPGTSSYPGATVSVDNTNPLQPKVAISGAPPVATGTQTGVVKPGTNCSVDGTGAFTCATGTPTAGNGIVVTGSAVAIDTTKVPVLNGPNSFTAGSNQFAQAAVSQLTLPALVPSTTTPLCVGTGGVVTNVGCTSSGGSSGSLVYTSELLSGTVNGSNTAFYASHTPAAGLAVQLNGLNVPPTAYTISGTAVTFSTAPSTGDVVTAYYAYSGTGGGAYFVSGEQLGGTPNGTLTSFTITNAPLPLSSLQITNNGLVLSPSTYSVSGTTVTFTSGTPQTGDYLSATYTYSSGVAGTSVVAPAISGEPLNALFTVKAAGNTVPVYNASVKQTINPAVSVGNDGTGAGQETGVSGFGSFSMTGTPSVTVTYTSAISSVVVKPAALNVVPVISGNTATFLVPKTGPMLVEVNGDQLNSLQLFANDLPSPPTAGSGVTILPLGRTNMDTAVVTANQTLYIPDGAILYANNTSNTHFINAFGSGIKIYGYGIVDGSALPDHQQNLLFTYQTPGIVVDGLVLRDSSSFHAFITQTNGATINNVKVLGRRLNSDGFDISNAQNITVTNCYARTFDDLFVVKATGATGLSDSNITFRNNVAWNSVAHAYSIGYENLAAIDGTTFDQNTVIRDRGRVTTFGVYGNNGGAITNTTFSNNVLEEVQMLLEVQLPNASGTISGVNLSNMSFPAHKNTNSNVNSQTTNIRVLGNNSTNAVSGATFTNIAEAGVNLLLSGITKNSFVSGVTVTP